MLDQKLIRENPAFVEESLSSRGKSFNIFQIHELTINKKQIDIEISSLQSESKKISKLIGQQISKSQNNESEELSELVPLSRTAKEQIDSLKEWSSSGRARSAS